jgi:hypothetical protein
MSAAFDLDSSCRGEIRGIGPVIPPLILRHHHSLASRFNGDFDDALAAFSKELISLRNSGERIRVGQEWSQIQAPVTDQLDQPAHALFPTRTECRDDLVVA